LKPIRYSTDARIDLREAWNYVGEYNEAAADNLVARITRSINRLSDFPELGRVRYDLDPRYRSLAVKPYVIFYRVLPDCVEVTRILHGARNLRMFFHSGEDESGEP
jgi:toxin ParE1/3/4